MVIDSHQHAFWHSRDDAGLVADMDSHPVRIDVSWLLTWEIPRGDDDKIYHRALNPLNVRTDGTHRGITLNDLLLARQRFPDRFIVGYCPTPMVGKPAEQFEAAYHVHKVRVCGEWKFRTCFDDPRCIELFRKAGELKCPVVLHLDVPWIMNAEGKQEFQPLWYGGTVANLERALKACPNTTFVGHAPGFWREISGDADTARGNYPEGPIVPGGRLFKLFDDNPNLCADLSAGSALRALKRDPAHAKQFLTRYQDRLLFGRDIYGTDLHQFLVTLDLPQTVAEKIYSGNALRLVPLP